MFRQKAEFAIRIASSMIKEQSMRISKILACCGLLFSLAAPPPFHAQAKSPQDIEKSCTNFVQGFYDWYVPKALKENHGPAFALALKHKSSVFSLALFRRLNAAYETQTKALRGDSGELDFDPFLNSQDPAERYVVGHITPQSQSVLVEVYGISSGKKSDQPDVVAELVLVDGQWVFVNFHYGERNDRESEDLLSLLEEMRESRRTHK